jgi:hypothetical protein
MAILLILMLLLFKAVASTESAFTETPYTRSALRKIRGIL